jgi:hypothetical protein
VAAFLANVGVNAGHAARSPLFADGSFALLPVPETQAWRRPMVRFGDLKGLTEHAPRSWRDRAMHLDPNLDSSPPTYGDNCRRAGRAFSLRRAQSGDLIVFLARLHAATTVGFYLVGCLEIDDVLPDVTSDPGSGWWDANAHVRRARATDDGWDSFWVFRGSRQSRRFTRAIPFTRRETTQAFGGDAWRWPAHRTELQTIGSYTRAVRRVEGHGEEWLRSICQS